MGRIPGVNPWALIAPPHAIRKYLIQALAKGKFSPKSMDFVSIHRRRHVPVAAARHQERLAKESMPHRETPEGGFRPDRLQVMRPDHQPRRARGNAQRPPQSDRHEGESCGHGRGLNAKDSNLVAHGRHLLQVPVSVAKTRVTFYTAFAVFAVRIVQVLTVTRRGQVPNGRLRGAGHSGQQQQRQRGRQCKGGK